MKKSVILLIILVLICGCSSKNNVKKEVSMINYDSVYNMIDDKNVYILDVREDYEYNNGHIKNAYNLPVSKIEKSFLSFIPKNSKIIVYCRSGHRSSKAADILLNLGYSNIYDMGGINDWEYELVTEQFENN